MIIHRYSYCSIISLLHSLYYTYLTCIAMHGLYSAVTIFLNLLTQCVLILYMKKHYYQSSVYIT